MTNKTMPEQLFVQPYEREDRYMTCNASQIGSDDVEYVRKDCIEQCAFNDELKSGQRRWVFWRESWFLVKVSVRKDGSVHFSVGDNRCGASFDSDDPDVLEIGPVVRAPKHKPTDSAARPKDDPDQDRSAFDSLMSRMSRVV